jgi:hypothetical protein
MPESGAATSASEIGVDPIDFVGPVDKFKAELERDRA